MNFTGRTITIDDASIRQIGGRAGRYSFGGNEESVGEVICMNSAEVSIVQKAFKNINKDVKFDSKNLKLENHTSQTDLGEQISGKEFIENSLNEIVNNSFLEKQNEKTTLETVKTNKNVIDSIMQNQQPETNPTKQTDEQETLNKKDFVYFQGDSTTKNDEKSIENLKKNYNHILLKQNDTINHLIDDVSNDFEPNQLQENDETLLDNKI